MWDEGVVGMGVLSMLWFFYGRRRAVDGWGGWEWTLVEVEIRSEYRLCMLLCVK